MDMIIKINLDNAAFEDDNGFVNEEEIKRILKTIRFEDEQRLVDINGNVVGSVEFIYDK